MSLKLLWNIIYNLSSHFEPGGKSRGLCDCIHKDHTPKLPGTDARDRFVQLAGWKAIVNFEFFWSPVEFVNYWLWADLLANAEDVLCSASYMVFIYLGNWWWCEVGVDHYQIIVSSSRHQTGYACLVKIDESHKLEQVCASTKCETMPKYA